MEWDFFAIENVRAIGEGLGIVATSALVGFILAKVLLRLLRWTGIRRSEHMDNVLRHKLRMPLFVMFPCIAVFLSLWAFYPEILELPVVIGIGKVGLVCLLVWLMMSFVQVLTTFIMRRYDIYSATNLRARSMHTQISVLHRIVNFVIILLGIASLFLLFDNLRSIGVSLVASAGVAGIAIGFAAQKALGNLLAGIQIAITQPIRMDDVVVVEGEWGWVEEITLTYVVVRIWDLRRLVLPISYFIEQPFENWTRSSSEILGSVYLYTDYTLPVERLRAKAEEIIEDHPKWNGNVKVLQVTSCMHDTIEVRALMSAKDSPTAWELRCDVREKLIAYIQQEYPEAAYNFQL